MYTRTGNMLYSAVHIHSIQGWVIECTGERIRTRTVGLITSGYWSINIYSWNREQENGYFSCWEIMNLL